MFLEEYFLWTVWTEQLKDIHILEVYSVLSLEVAGKGYVRCSARLRNRSDATHMYKVYKTQEIGQ